MYREWNDIVLFHIPSCNVPFLIINKRKKKKKRKERREFSRKEMINFIDEFLIYRKRKLRNCKYFRTNAGQNSKEESRNFSTGDLETATTWKRKYVPKFCIRQHKKKKSSNNSMVNHFIERFIFFIFVSSCLRSPSIIGNGRAMGGSRPTKQTISALPAVSDST